MKQPSRIAVTFVVGAALLLLADMILQPVPIPAGVPVLGGLAADGIRGLAVGALVIFFVALVVGVSSRKSDA